MAADVGIGPKGMVLTLGARSKRTALIWRYRARLKLAEVRTARSRNR